MPLRRRGIEGGVAVEEADRLEHEPCAVHGHDRPVLRPREVRQAEGVPHHDVGAVDVASARIQVSIPVLPGFWLTN